MGSSDNFKFSSFKCFRVVQKPIDTDVVNGSNLTVPVITGELLEDRGQGNQRNDDERGAGDWDCNSK